MRKKKKKKAKIQDSMISLLYVCFTHIMMAASEEIPTVLLWWPTMSETVVGDLAVEDEITCQYSAKFCCLAAAAKGHSDKMVSYTEVHMKQTCITELLLVEKIVLTDIN